MLFSKVDNSLGQRHNVCRDHQCQPLRDTIQSQQCQPVCLRWACTLPSWLDFTVGVVWTEVVNLEMLRWKRLAGELTADVKVNEGTLERIVSFQNNRPWPSTILLNKLLALLKFY